jgi:uncharacterized protein
MARHLIVLLTAVVALAACQSTDAPPDTARVAPGAQAAAAQVAVTAVPEGVTVTGHGRVTGQPDTLRATVGVHVVRADVEQAFDDAAAAADRVLAAVREHGVAEEDIQTREFTVWPEEEYRPDRPPAITGYAVRNLVEVTIRDIDQAGELLAAVADAAGDDARVQGLHFSLEDNDAQLQGARQEAFEDARRKAEHYAQLAGRTLGDLVSITETTAQLPPPIPLPDVALEQRAAAPPVMPGQQEVGVQLQATWALR